MRLLLMDNEYLIEPNHDAVQTIMNIIRETSEKNTLFFYALRIDEEEIYDQFEEALQERLQSINTVEAVLKTNEQLYTTTLLSVSDYIEGSLPYLHTLVEQFYDNPTEQAWISLGQLVEGMQWLQRTSGFYQEYRDMLDFSNEITTLEAAVSQIDNVMIGDIIQYEIIPRYEKLFSRLKKNIRIEVESDDIY